MTDEQKAAVQAFENPDNVLASGVRLGGQKFFAIQANPRSVYTKKQVSCYFHARPTYIPKLTMLPCIG